MTNEHHLSSPPLPPDDARSLVVDLEHTGLDSQTIAVATAPVSTPAQMARSDQRSITRPAKRVALGAGLGLVLGLALGAGGAIATDASAAQLLVPMAIVATLMGGLIGLYSRLTMHRDMADIDGGGRSIVSVDLTNVDDADRRKNVADLFSAADAPVGRSVS